MKVYLVQDSPFDPLVMEGIRDTETIPGAKWSKVVLQSKHITDPFRTREAAEKLMVQCIDLGVPCQVVEVDYESLGQCARENAEQDILTKGPQSTIATVDERIERRVRANNLEFHNQWENLQRTLSKVLSSAHDAGGVAGNEYSSAIRTAQKQLEGLLLLS